MRLRLPYVLAVDQWQFGNRVRQVGAHAADIEGTLTTFQRDRLKGWLLLPAEADDAILIVPTRIKPNQVPHTYRRVLISSEINLEAAEVDLRSAPWLRHPMLGVIGQDAAEEHRRVLASWKDAFSYVEEDPENALPGLRRPQIGALHAIHAHWTTSESPATIVMPTGTGKTETMLSVLVTAQCKCVLVVVPTDALRTQIAEKFLSLGVLRLPGVPILRGTALAPRVVALRHVPASADDVKELFSQAHVIVATSSIAGQCAPEVLTAMATNTSHLFIDEAHHAEAPTWKQFKSHFGARRILQFTATPFREDGKPVDGKLVYVYPLRKAQDEGYFRKIQFLNVFEFDPNRSDEAIAEKAIEQLRKDFDKGHILMARVEGVSRAKQVFELYQRYPEFNPIQLHTGIKSGKAREEARRKLLSKEARIVVCVDMLGEGFDLPELKIAAFHDIRKTLAVTLQLAGRFTRVRPDLGNATFVANTADVSVREELRKLYARDPDWNLLLPQMSETMMAEQQSLQQFLDGFTEFADEIPLKTVQPALSAVVYRTTCSPWAPEKVKSGIPKVSACEQVHIARNEAEGTLVVLTARRVPLPFTDVEGLVSWQWELYVLFWWSEKNLLFINGSTLADQFQGLAMAVAGQDAQLIRGQDVFRSFCGVNRLRLRTVGLTEQLGRNVSFTSRMGPDVAPVVSDAQRRKTRKSVLAGSGYEGGAEASVGASQKGRIWSHRRGRLNQFVSWCKKVGAKLIDESIDPDVVLKGTLKTEIVAGRPGGMPLSVDWPEEVYISNETLWSVSLDDAVLNLSDVELELIDASPSGAIKVAVKSDHASAAFELEFFQRDEILNFRWTATSKTAMTVLRGGDAVEGATFFSEHSPRIWFADGASLDGNEYTPFKSDLPPYDRDKIVAWTWPQEINIRKESQGEAKEQDSVQAFVISKLKAENYDLIFDDDGSGEAADVVAVRVVGPHDAPTLVEVEFYHCKFSAKDAAGGRVDDLYVVCGQAQTSIRWMASMEKRIDLFTHLMRREAMRQKRGAPSRIEKGDVSLLQTLREMSYTARVTLRIAVVQPGVSLQAISGTQLRLLSVTENYLLETYQLPFTAILSP